MSLKQVDVGGRAPSGEPSRRSLTGFATEWVTHVVYLSVIWAALVLLAGVVLGVGPATVALLVVMRRCVDGEYPASLAHQFWSVYRSCFLRANALALVSAGALGVCSFNVAAGASMTSPTGALLRPVVLAVLLLLVFVLVSVWATSARLERLELHSVRVAVHDAVLAPHRAALKLLALAALLVLLRFVPGLAVAAGPGLAALGVVWSDRIRPRLLAPSRALSGGSPRSAASQQERN